MPMPGPISSQRRRSAGEPSTNRGYHESGTDTTRPSRSSTTRARSVTCTLFAATVSVVDAEVLMPCLQEGRFVFADDRRDTTQLSRTETVIVRSANGCQPELRRLAVTCGVNVRRF